MDIASSTGIGKYRLVTGREKPFSGKCAGLVSDMCETSGKTKSITSAESRLPGTTYQPTSAASSKWPLWKWEEHSIQELWSSPPQAANMDSWAEVTVTVSDFNCIGLFSLTSFAAFLQPWSLGYYSLVFSGIWLQFGLIWCVRNSTFFFFRVYMSIESERNLYFPAMDTQYLISFWKNVLGRFVNRR